MRSLSLHIFILNSKVMDKYMQLVVKLGDHYLKGSLCTEVVSIRWLCKTIQLIIPVHHYSIPLNPDAPTDLHITLCKEQ